MELGAKNIAKGQSNPPCWMLTTKDAFGPPASRSLFWAIPTSIGTSKVLFLGVLVVSYRVVPRHGRSLSAQLCPYFNICLPPNGNSPWSKGERRSHLDCLPIFCFLFFFLMRFRHVVRYPIHNESGDICCVVLHGRFPGQRCKALSSFFFLRQKLTYY